MKRATMSGLLIFALSVPVSLQAQKIPPRPEALSFEKLEFNPTRPEDLRVVLDNGMPAYVIEDPQLPLVTIVINFRGGRYLEPVGKEGLASLTGSVWRTGGTDDLSPQALDEELDYLAANLSTSIGGTSSRVSLDLLSKDLDRGLVLLMDVLRRPRFEPERLSNAKENALAGMRRRNDRTASIESREWNRLLYGESYWINRLATQSSIDSIERGDLVAFRQRIANPKNAVAAISGDFNREEMLEKLNATLGQWQGEEELVPEVPQPTHRPKAGVYLVNKTDVNQGRVSIGHLGLRWPVAEEYALQIANDVLGGGGFTSWMVSRIRSDEGLAYSASSRYGINTAYPGSFRASFQSKSSTCTEAARLSLELIARLRSEGIDQKSLMISRNSFVETFPNRFSSANQTVGLYARDELVGRPPSYLRNYRSNMEAVSLSDVQDAAKLHIRLDELVVLMVGNIEEILSGHPDYPEARLEDFGPITQIPLRDPLTLVPNE